MAKVKKKPAPDDYGRLIVLLAAAVFMLAALFACGLLGLFAFGAPEEPAAEAPQPGENVSTGANGIVHPVETGDINVSSDDLSLWADINNANVEKACLARAKEEAGGSASLVYSCECEESAAPLVKSYECSISTADPFTEYFANIECVLSDAACSVETNYGTANVSFTEIREYGFSN